MNPVSVQQKRLSEQLLLMTPSHPQNFKLGLLKLDGIFMLQLAFVERKNTMQYGIKSVRYTGH